MDEEFDVDDVYGSADYQNGELVDETQQQQQQQQQQRNSSGRNSRNNQMPVVATPQRGTQHNRRAKTQHVRINSSPIINQFIFYLIFD